jgi:Flp pilus assembly protein TadD
MNRPRCLLLGALLTTLLATGCATVNDGAGDRDTAQAGPAQRAGGGGCRALDGDQELVLNLAQDMVDAGRFHAALANLERLPAALPEVRLRKARILRILGRPQAEELYRGLLDSCLKAEGYHGLGQLAAAHRRYRESAGYLRRAVELAPANPAIRNDLGVVYLHLRQLPQARFELMTAMELDEGDHQAIENLLALLIYEGRWQQAGELAHGQGLTADRFREAEQRARRLRDEDARSDRSGGRAAGGAARPAASGMPPLPAGDEAAARELPPGSDGGGSVGGP